MITQYLTAAMNRATYKLLKDGSYFGEIPGLQGVWANEPTLEKCREELASVLEDWVLIHLHEQSKLPIIDGISLNMKVKKRAAA